LIARLTATFGFDPNTNFAVLPNVLGKGALSFIAVVSSVEERVVVMPVAVLIYGLSAAE